METKVVTLVDAVGDGHVTDGSIPVDDITSGTVQANGSTVNGTEVDGNDDTNATVVDGSEARSTLGTRVIELNGAVGKGSVTNGPVLGENVASQTSDASGVVLVGAVGNGNEDT